MGRKPEKQNLGNQPRDRNETVRTWGKYGMRRGNEAEKRNSAELKQGHQKHYERQGETQ